MMKCKKILALVLSILVIFSLTSCKEKENTTTTPESTTEYNNTVSETAAENVLNTESAILNSTTESYTQESSQPTSSEVADTSTEPATKETPKETERTTSAEFDDPSKWSKERIVEEYKKAAKKSNPVTTSTQNITLKEIHINNGEYDSAISMVKPIIAKFIESKSTEIEGITGGFNDLVPRDVNSANAYKSGNDTVIEMVMVEQTSGAKDDALSGSVGHAITAVGDISNVTKDLSDMGLPLEISEDDTKIYYTNPVVKVTINESGEIINGTWSYTVEISMNNLKAFGKTVDNASIIMENTITV